MSTETHPPAAGRGFRPEAVLVVVFLYGFLVSIKLMGAGFHLLGGGFASLLQGTVQNPLVGLALGILVTSVVQSSSLTTSIVVGLVASGQLSVALAVPIVMGANIGTTITNTLVSIAHVPHRPEFRRAVTTATLHDFFNLCCVFIFFPLELATGFLRYSASLLTGLLVGVKAGKMPSPLSLVVKPVVRAVEAGLTRLITALQGGNPPAEQLVGLVMVILALGVLFVSLTFLVRNLRRLLTGRMEGVLDRYLLASTFRGLLLGLGLTVLVQSSSVTTSFMVPLGAAGLVSLERAFPYMMGANIGTTVTAILASLATDSPQALTIALVHLLFNATGVAVMLAVPPLRRVPLFLARTMGDMVMRRRVVVLVYAVVVFFVVPGILIVLGRWLAG